MAGPSNEWCIPEQGVMLALGKQPASHEMEQEHHTAATYWLLGATRTCTTSVLEEVDEEEGGAVPSFEIATKETTTSQQHQEDEEEEEEEEAEGRRKRHEGKSVANVWRFRGGMWIPAERFSMRVVAAALLVTMTLVLSLGVGMGSGWSAVVTLANIGPNLREGAAADSLYQILNDGRVDPELSWTEESSKARSAMDKMVEDNNEDDETWRWRRQPVRLSYLRSAV